MKKENGVQTEQTINHKEEIDKLNNRISSAIALSLDLDRLFKLFSYRIIDREYFVNEVEQAVEIAHQAKKLK